MTTRSNNSSRSSCPLRQAYLSSSVYGETLLEELLQASSSFVFVLKVGKHMGSFVGTANSGYIRRQTRWSVARLKCYFIMDIAFSRQAKRTEICFWINTPESGATPACDALTKQVS